MKIAIKNRWLLPLMVFVFNALFVLLIVNAVGIVFDSTDDVGMCYVANGKVFGTPDCHLVFINAIYGSLLASLYTLLPKIEWYSILFLVIHVLSISTISLCVIRNNFNRLPKVVFLVTVYVFWIRCITGFQFTTTAGVACFAGCLLLLKESTWKKVCGILFILVASMIRFEMTAFIGLIFSPMIFYTYGKEWKRYFSLLVMLLLVLGIKGADSLFYQSDDWKNYKDYNCQRSKINDNPNAGVLFSTQVEGLSENDIRMILGTEQDATIVDANRLRDVNKVVSEKTHLSKFLKVYQLKHYLLFFVVFAFVLAFVLFGKSPKREKVLALFSYGLFVALIAYKSIDWYLKDRVIIPSIVPLLYIFVYCLQNTTIRYSIKTGLIVALGLFVSIVFSKQIIGVYSSKAELENIWNKQYELMTGNGLKMLWPSDIAEQGLNPFKIKDNDVDYVFGGWFLGYPAKNALHNNKELIDKNVGILLSNDYGWDTLIMEHYTKCLEEHYFIDAEAFKIDSCDKYSFYVLKGNSPCVENEEIKFRVEYDNNRN